MRKRLPLAAIKAARSVNADTRLKIRRALSSAAVSLGTQRRRTAKCFMVLSLNSGDREDRQAYTH